jgi:hypothetical protein
LVPEETLLPCQTIPHVCAVPRLSSVRNVSRLLWVIRSNLSKTRYVKTSEYWPTEVMAIEGDGMTVRWLGDVGPSEPSKLPLGYVRTIGADGDYGDGCSALGGASSSKTTGKKRKRAVGQTMEEFSWALYDVTKMVVAQKSGAYEDSSVSERTMLTFICIIKTGGKWVRQLHKEIGLMQAL